MCVNKYENILDICNVTIPKKCDQDWYSKKIFMPLKSSIADLDIVCAAGGLVKLKEVLIPLFRSNIGDKD